MKKILIFGVVAGLLLAATSSLADKSSPKLAGNNSPKLTLNWQNEVNPSKCDRVGAPVINVTQKVKNDADSGIAGNYWAFDNYKREIKVWPTSTPGTFCAIVKYEGKFKGVGGQISPGGSGMLSGKEHGTMKGGYRAIVTGSLLSNPTWPIHGSVGKFNYQCDINGNCPGRVSWLNQYFTAGYGFDQPWWGWIYRSDCGTWVNAVSGNLGNIICPADTHEDTNEDTGEDLD